MRPALLAVLTLLCVVAPAATANPRSTGGTPVTAGAHPAVVLVEGPNIFGQIESCTGVLVSKRIVVTSVTCVFFIDLDAAHVIVGRTSRAADDGRGIAVDGFDVPPMLDLGPPARGDVIRIRLAADAPATPAPLAAPGSIVAGATGTLVSWGAVNADGAAPNLPQALSMVVLSDADCTASWGRQIAARETFCAAGTTPGTGTCLGDSGAPLLVSTPQGDRLLGVVSSLAGCPDATLPTTFSRLADDPLRAFLGAPEAIAVPEQIAETSLHGQPWVGGGIRCDPGTWASKSPVRFTYLWFRDLDLLPKETKARRRLTIADRGTQVTCVVIAENASGANFGVAGFPTVGAGTPVSDTTAPLVKSARGACGQNTCTFKIRATDASGIRRVELGVRSSRGVRLMAMTRRGKSFIASLPRREHELLVIATDNKGNESKPFRRTLSTAGTLSRARHPRVIGGTPAAATDYPFIGALIARGVDPAAGQSCTGTLIAPTLFLTAAHCVAGTRATDWDVLFGQALLSGTGGQRIPAASLSWHPDFSDELLGSDVALVHLARAPLAPVAPVPLIDQAHAAAAAPGTPARVLGWGSTRLDDEVQILPDDLRTAVLTLRDDATCTAGAGFPYAGATMLCADASPTGQTTCFGDSGGPLLVDDGAGGWLVAGVTSWALACGSTISPSVFADVLQLRPWIVSSPPAAPIRAGSVYISGHALVGRSIHCVAQITGATSIAIKWRRAGVPIATGPSYRVRRADAGAALGCTVTARNAGGTVHAGSQPVVIGADLRLDHRRPTLTRPDILCTQQLGEAVLCNVRTTATDRNGIAAVSFLVAADARPLRWVHGASENGQLWQAHLPAAGRYTIVARAVDEAGNIARASRAANTTPG
jgi:secreted trypsin-like serine protease